MDESDNHRGGQRREHSPPARLIGALNTTVMLVFPFAGRCRLLQTDGFSVPAVRGRNAFITPQLPLPPRCESVVTCTTQYQVTTRTGHAQQTTRRPSPCRL